MRIAIVNDVPMIVEALRRLMRGVGHEVAWLAGDGAEALRKCVADRPDLILMDLMMPVMDGVECTRQIMAASPCAILVVTSTVAGSYEKVYEAMALGALDAVDTPRLDSGTGAAPLLAKIATISKLVRPNAVPTRSALATPARAPANPVPAPTGTRPPLVAIGASTGGPRALADVLGSLGRDFPAAIVIVQHVDVHFAAGLATWLSQHSGFPVELIAPGARPRAGAALLASTADHLIMGPDGQLSYTPRPTSYHYRPSADVFFTSLAAHWKSPSAAALLTGMGRDGAEGLLLLRRAGWLTIAQDEASSVVYGMPRAAAELGAAVSILGVKQIGPTLAAHFRPRT